MTMIKILVCVLATVLIVAATSPSIAQSEESLIWRETSDGNAVSLSYGSLDDSKNPIFLLSCFNAMDVAVLNVFSVIEGKRPGQPVAIELSAGSKNLSLDAESSIDSKTSSMFAESGEVALEPILAVLQESGPVTVKLAFTTKTLSDAGREAAVVKFIEDCELD